jgi:hypothetical protein
MHREMQHFFSHSSPFPQDSGLGVTLSFRHRIWVAHGRAQATTGV